MATAAKYENESVAKAKRPFASEKTLDADWSIQRIPSSLRRMRNSEEGATPVNERTTERSSSIPTPKVSAPTFTIFATLSERSLAESETATARSERKRPASTSSPRTKPPFQVSEPEAFNALT